VAVALLQIRHRCSAICIELIEGLAAVIRPHQLRLLLVTWVSDICLDKGATSVMDQISLRVRVGWFTRTEQIPLLQGWGVAGPSHGTCD
jgi:hypothetical protein